MDPKGGSGARGRRGRARGRAGSQSPSRAEEVAGDSPPIRGTPTEGPGSPQNPEEKAAVYSHMFADSSRRLSEGSSSSNGNGGSGNGGSDNGKANSNGGSENGNGKGRGSPYESRGGSPRGLSPRAGGSPGGSGAVAVDYVFSRPSTDFVKKVMRSPNQPEVSVVANYYPMKTHPLWNLSLYAVKVEPPEDSNQKIRKLILTQKEKIGSYLATGLQLFTTRQIPEDNLVLQIDLDGIQYTVTFNYLRPVTESDPMVIQFYNVVVRQIQSMMNYKLLGRHYFDPTQEVKFPAWHLNLWPGFQNSIRQQDGGLMLNVESVWKVLQSDSILNIMTNIRRQRPANLEQAYNEAIVGMMVVTLFNTKAYKVSRIDFTATPRSSFSKSDGTSISYVDYYKSRYDIDVKEHDFPMLVSAPSRRQIRIGQVGDIYLCPELCYPCGLNDALRSNFKLMKDLASCLHTPPAPRVDTMNKFITGVVQKKEIVETLRNWGLKIGSSNPVEISARMIPSEDIIMAGGAKVRPDDKADWTMGLRGKQMMSTKSLKDWAIVITNRDSANVGQLINTMQKVATPLGYVINQPHIERVSDARALPQGVNDACGKLKVKNDMIMVVLANNNADTYAAVKKRCSIDFGVPSQCFLAKNMTSKGLMSIATKLVIQMNAKQGGEPWGVINQLKNQNLMVLGYDVHHAGPAGGHSIGAMTATVTNTLGSYYSCVERIPADRAEVATSVAKMFEKCLKAYLKRNGDKYPERILMYRDGVGEGQLYDVYNLEINAFKDRMKKLYSERSQELPKLAFVVVNKRISTRFFVKGGRERFDNPKPGLVVDDVVTRPERYDFFLISQTARQGCVSPTYYNVLMDETNLGPDKLQKFTYKLCHMYYNWSGTVSVPAPCQNAHKLAFLVGTALKRPAHMGLDYLLHFL